ncbi:hypothetical protein D3C84_797400 [compost metagenome]
MMNSEQSETTSLRYITPGSLKESENSFFTEPDSDKSSLAVVSKAKNWVCARRISVAFVESSDTLFKESVLAKSRNSEKS